MPSSPPGMGERVLRRLRDASRRSLPPGLAPDVMWSLVVAGARRRTALTLSLAVLVLVVLPVGCSSLAAPASSPARRASKPVQGDSPRQVRHLASPS